MTHIIFFEASSGLWFQRNNDDNIHVVKVSNGMHPTQVGANIVLDQIITEANWDKLVEKMKDSHHQTPA